MKIIGITNMATRKKFDIRVSDISAETANRFDEIKNKLYPGEKSGVNKKTFETILKTHQFFNFKLSEEEKETLEYINNTVPDIFEKKIKQVISTLGNKLKNTDYDDADLSLKNSSKSSFLRVEKIVDELVKQNETVKEWFDRRYINQKTIFEFAKEKKRLTPDFLAVSSRSIKQYLAINKNKIDEYNKKHDMSEDHNLKVYYFKLKQSKV